jgi:hypothetical protein
MGEVTVKMKVWSFRTEESEGFGKSYHSRSIVQHNRAALVYYLFFHLMTATMSHNCWKESE